jgi:tRNA (cmo5U34)-methyltransferase
MTAQTPKDQLYAKPLATIEDFVFDEQVADVFPDMLLRSIPGYRHIIHNIGILGAEYAQADTTIYDLGCSLGAATLSVAHRIDFANPVIAVDNAEAMVKQCRQRIEQAKAKNVDVLCADIRDVDISNASVIVMNFTLQFIPPEERLKLLQKINRGLVPGGCLILSEKITFDDPEETQFNEAMHRAFKLANGYSDLEISQKRSALENVLVSDTLEIHYQRLREAGFSEIHNWFRCYNFASLIAIKR